MRVQDNTMYINDKYIPRIDKPYTYTNFYDRFLITSI